MDTGSHGDLHGAMNCDILNLEAARFCSASLLR